MSTESHRGEVGIELLDPSSFSPSAASKPKPGTRRETFNLQEGEIVIEWPEAISESSYEDAKDWAELFLRRLKRSVASPAAAGCSTPPVTAKAD